MSGVHFCKIFNSNLSSFALWKTSSFVILSVHFIISILLQHHVSSTQFIFPALLSCAVARTAESPPNSSTWACFAAAQSLMWFLLFVVFMDTYRNVVVSNKIQTVPVRKMPRPLFMSSLFSLAVVYNTLWD